MKNICFALLTCLLFSQTASAKKCDYSVDEKTVRVSWTAFKTMQKVEVNGSFPELEVKGALAQQVTFKKFLEQVSVKIKVDEVSKINTGNLGRNQTLLEHFFSHFAKNGEIDGHFSGITGTDSKGAFELALEMNETLHKVPMTYTRDKDGKFEAKGQLDVQDFKLVQALQDLHQKCEALHKGPDGVSKTWPGVDIKIEAVIVQKCSS